MTSEVLDRMIDEIKDLRRRYAHLETSEYIARSGDVMPRGPHPWTDVRAYGAVGDGVTDDTTAIQAAIDSAPSGLVVFFPGGDYRVDSQIDIDKAVYVKGDKATLYPEGAVTFPVFSITHSDVTISNIRFDESNVTAANTTDTFQMTSIIDARIPEGTVANVRIANCTLVNIKGSGIRVGTNNVDNISDVYIESNLLDGIEGFAIVVARASRAHVLNNRVYDVNGRAIRVVGAVGNLPEHCVISGNIIKNVPGANMQVGYPPVGIDARIKRSVISNNILDTITGMGITEGEECVISGNVIRNISAFDGYQFGIEVTNPDTVVADNYIDVGATEAPAWDVIVQALAHRAQVLNNHLMKRSFVATTSENVLVEGNYFADRLWVHENTKGLSIIANIFVSSMWMVYLNTCENVTIRANSFKATANLPDLQIISMAGICSNIVIQGNSFSISGAALSTSKAIGLSSGSSKIAIVGNNFELRPWMCNGSITYLRVINNCGIGPVAGDMSGSANTILMYGNEWDTTSGTGTRSAFWVAVEGYPLGTPIEGSENLHHETDVPNFRKWVYLGGVWRVADADTLDGLHANATGAADAHVVATDAAGNAKAVNGTFSGGLNVGTATGAGAGDGLFSGKVGIGTVSPSKPLHVRVGAAAGLVLDADARTVAVFEAGTAGARIALASPTDGSSAIDFSDDDWNVGEILYNHATNYMSFRVNDAERLRIASGGSVGIGTVDQFGGGVKVIGIANRTTAPDANPTGGGVLYCESGALKYRGSSGTVTTIANA